MPQFCNLRHLKNSDELRNFLSAVVLVKSKVAHVFLRLAAGASNVSNPSDSCCCSAGTHHTPCAALSLSGVKQFPKMQQVNTSGPAMAFYKCRLFRFLLSPSTEHTHLFQGPDIL